MASAILFAWAVLVLQAQAGALSTAQTKATMDSWMATVTGDAELRRPLLTPDVYMVVVSDRSAEPLTLEGADEVINFYKEYGHARKVQDFMSVDGSAFAIETETGVSVFEPSAEGKISSIRTWLEKVDLQSASLVAAPAPTKKSKRKSQSKADLKQKHEALLAALRDPSTSPRAETTTCTQSEHLSKLSKEQKEQFEALSKKLATIDFDPVIARLVKKEEYEPLEAKAAVEEYRKFLVLLGMGLNPVPSEKVDDAWHAHILYTQKYEKDCNDVFGEMIHHQPANLLLEQDGLQQQRSTMLELYNNTQQHLCDYFGAIDTVIWAQDQAGHCHCHCHCR